MAFATKSRLACVRGGDGCLLLIICVRSHTQRRDHWAHHDNDQDDILNIAYLPQKSWLLSPFSVLGSHLWLCKCAPFAFWVGCRSFAFNYNGTAYWFTKLWGFEVMLWSQFEMPSMRSSWRHIMLIISRQSHTQGSLFSWPKKII